MNSASKSCQFGFVLSAMAMLCGAAAIWSSKSHDLSAREDALAKEQLQSRRTASELLRRSFQADSELSYSAVSSTVAFIGGRSLQSTAQITRAPHFLAIKMLSGPMRGVQSGYSERWLWRQDTAKAIKPYAESTCDIDAMATRRFALLAKNYEALLGKPQMVEGRSTQVVELQPLQPAVGAKGPGRRLFIDGETGLTLRIESYNCHFRPVMNSTLSKLNMHPVVNAKTFEPPATIKATLKNADWRGEEMGTDYEAAAHKTGFMPPHPTYLPAGFELDGYGIHRCRTTGTLQLAAFSRYTDGLNTLTVFAFKPVNEKVEKTMRGACDFGPGAMRSREDSGGRLVALGDLPTQTLESVLESAKFEPAKMETVK